MVNLITICLWRQIGNYKMQPAGLDYFGTIIRPIMHLEALKLLDITFLRRSHIGMYWIFEPLEKFNWSQSMNNQ